MSFCTVINCLDGRTQIPVIAYLRDRLSVEYVDLVTEAGPVRVLSSQPESEEALSIFRRVEVSIEAHRSRGIAIVAHHDCAGNAISDIQQKQQLQVCLQLLSRRYPRHEVVGLWVDKTWTVCEPASEG